MTCTHKTSIPNSQISYVPHFGNMINELFNTAVGDVVQKSESRHFTNPATNVIAYDDRYELQISLPGFGKEDVAIVVENNLLKISAKERERDISMLKYRLREFNYAGFKKTYNLPETADAKQIKAMFDLGVLNITLPKKEEAIPQPARTIKIK